MRKLCWVWLVVLVALVACGTASLKSPGDVSGHMVEELLGGPPDLAMTMRVRRAMGDPLYGPILRCALEHATAASGAPDLAGQAESVDAWLREDAPSLDKTSMVAVVRGAPRFDPTAFRNDAGEAEWLAGRPVGGVVEFAPSPAGRDLWLFVLPDGTLTMARGRAAAHTRDHFARIAAVPAPLEAESTALVVAWIGGALVAEHTPEIGRELDGVTTTSLALVSGPDIGGVARLQLDTEPRAVGLEQRMRDWGVRDCATCRAVARFLHVERAGRQLRVDLAAPGSELDDLRGLACSAGKKPAPEAQPLPPDYAKPGLVPPRVAFVGGRDVVVAWAPFEVKPGEIALQLATYDDRGKLLRRLDAGSLPWRADGDVPLAMSLEHVIAGNKLVVHDTTYVKHDDEAVWIYDVASGKRTGGMVVPARGRLCASPTEPLVFVEDDEAARQTLIHVDSGQFEKSARPAFCPERPKGGPCAQPATIATCLEPASAPAVPEITPLFALALGDDGVLLGERAEGGRRVPMAAGFDVTTRAIRWKRVLPATSHDVADEGSARIAEIAYGMLLVEYDEWHGKWKLAALDVKTGVTKWDTPIKEPFYFAVSPTRVWFEDIERRPGEKPEILTTLKALDLTTGKPQ